MARIFRLPIENAARPPNPTSPGHLTRILFESRLTVVQYDFMEVLFVVLSGCSSGGKSSILEELRSWGYCVIDETGRRIVRRELAGGGHAPPWLDLAAFAREAVCMARNDLKLAATLPGWVFFDRGLVDALVALHYATGKPLPSTLSGCYHSAVFLVPPWEDI
jgi:predicted ATPase